MHHRPSVSSVVYQMPGLVATGLAGCVSSSLLKNPPAIPAYSVFGLGPWTLRGAYFLPALGGHGQ